MVGGAGESLVVWTASHPTLAAQRAARRRWGTRHSFLDVGYRNYTCGRERMDSARVAGMVGGPVESGCELTDALVDLISA